METVRINPEVQQALKENRPVVALESTIISHGMPYPQNEETALKVDQSRRDHGGESLASNIQLVFNNAAVGTEIAKAYCELTK